MACPDAPGYSFLSNLGSSKTLIELNTVQSVHWHADERRTERNTLSSSVHFVSHLDTSRLVGAEMAEGQ